MEYIKSILAALRFAAKKHAHQVRKDPEKTPYIVHPIAVAELLARVALIDDCALLQAALLHDTLEDTATTPEELAHLFGEEVCKLVLEVTDDKSLPKATRKYLQEEHSAHLSPRAKQLKIADKAVNCADLSPESPADWPLGRKVEYLAWSERVVRHCRGYNCLLGNHFDQVLRDRRSILQID